MLMLAEMVCIEHEMCASRCCLLDGNRSFGGGTRQHPHMTLECDSEEQNEHRSIRNICNPALAFPTSMVIVSKARPGAGACNHSGDIAYPPKCSRHIISI